MKLNNVSNQLRGQLWISSYKQLDGLPYIQIRNQRWDQETFQIRDSIREDLR